MGPYVLILWALLALIGCGRAPSGEPHAQIPCGSCHAGRIAELNSASVPDESCTLSGCHPDGGPQLVRLDAVAFQHRGHGKRSKFGAPGCAGCHEHGTEDRRPIANLDACVLCHREDVFDPKKRDCALCHGSTSHVDASAQGLRVAHGWQEDGTSANCVRCHYDVGSPTVELAIDRCAHCHDDPTETLRGQMSPALHPTHMGISCHRCHGEGDHGIRSMSSAVELDCHQCHSGLHPEEEELDADMPPMECLQCHDEPHVAQQRMVLGLIDDQEFPHVLGMFTAGLSCHSCHVAEPSQHPATPSAISCAGCHPPEYSRVLNWWSQGIEKRMLLVTGQLQTAETLLQSAASDTVGVELGRASRLLKIVRDGGGHHNLELSDWIFHRASAAIESAYRLAAARVPPPPDLGARLNEDPCVSCHYLGFESDEYVELPIGSHRRYLRAGG
jgi:hypothetical protein